jgi:hypothetical protein
MDLLLALIIPIAPFAVLGFYGWKSERDRRKAYLHMINTVTPAKSKHEL